MMREDKYCPVCPFNHPQYSPQLKFNQYVVCLTLANHGYICRKDITASGTIVDQFNTKLSKMNDQSCTRKLVAKRVSDDKASAHVSARRVHPPSITRPPLDSSVPPTTTENNLLLLPNQSAQMPTFNRYTNIYAYDSEDEQLFE